MTDASAREAATGREAREENGLGVLDQPEAGRDGSGNWRRTKAPGGTTEGREGERSEPGLTAGGTPGAAPAGRAAGRPNPEVVAQAKRRTFSAKYKLKVLAEADKCVKGELGALLRREGIYDSTYRQWLKQREDGVLQGLTPRKRGPAPKPVDPSAKRVSELERENRKLTERLKKAELIIDVQKKVASLLGIELASTEDQRDRS
jgi:transposase-like protein